MTDNRTRPATPEYREGWERIFGQRPTHLHPEAWQVLGNESPERFQRFEAVLQDRASGRVFESDPTVSRAWSLVHLQGLYPDLVPPGPVSGIEHEVYNFETGASWYYCAVCGVQLDPNAETCPRCGTDLRPRLDGTLTVTGIDRETKTITMDASSPVEPEHRPSNPLVCTGDFWRNLNAQLDAAEKDK